MSPYIPLAMIPAGASRRPLVSIRIFLRLLLDTALADLKVLVKGAWIPTQLFGYFQLVFSSIRMFFISFWILLFARQKYEIIIVDQLSHSIPILKLTKAKILFYCHFPDQLLAPKSPNLLRQWIYRGILDRLEGRTMSFADRLVVNSYFTAGVFMSTFRKIQVEPLVLYPGVDIKRLHNLAKNSDEVPWAAPTE